MSDKSNAKSRIRSNLHGFALACIVITLCYFCNYALAQENSPGTTVENPKEPQTSSEPELKMAVELADGSRVVGTPTITELSPDTKIGTITVPLKGIKDVSFGPDGGDAVVTFANGDHVSGVLGQTTFNLEATWGKVALPLQQIRTITIQAVGNKWSVREDFSTASNPSGPWSYGWASEPGGKLILYSDKSHQDGSDASQGWRMRDGAPCMWINQSDHAMYCVKPGEVSLHPGEKGEEAVVRWQAAKSCKIVVKGTFGAGDIGSVDVRVRHNGAVSFESLDTKKDEPFSLELDVKSGDVVDFAVGAGRNGYYYGNTPLDAIISVE